ncbi:Bacterial regulatory proteins, tetR family [Caprobacter fermentans]|uniref:Bacterial regulatory proteins, tetR family n=1 Tax=Caproicibacter fermentans TaxID=2576756 RepID=A0A6N8HZE4_9FIRM|nr:TetR/AcrR family transcriptional regulator [Caproicibacter fermentans]MVB10975.1 Bacterial regulatory proteins, tetR family [Caproicibacter fermentans]
MPKQKTSKEEILRAAFRVLREQGAGELNARRIAEEAGCSVQPIYSYFGGMEELMTQLFEGCRRYLYRFIEERSNPEQRFQSAGKCHLAFAKEEKNLFRFLFLSPYMKANTFEEVYRQCAVNGVTQEIKSTLGLTEAGARRLYMSMMIYTHGIACMLAAEAANLPFEDIHPQVDFAFFSFLNQIRKEENSAGPSSGEKPRACGNRKELENRAGNRSGEERLNNK